MAMLLSMRAGAEEISWMVGIAPPLFMPAGGEAGQGISDLQIDFLAKHLAGFTHSIARATAKRSYFELTHRDGVCSVTLLRDAEREKLIAYSARPVIVPAFRLVTLEKSRDALAPYLTVEGEVDLEALAHGNSWRGAYVQSILYPAPIKHFLNDIADKSRAEGVTDPAPLISLLRAGRVDFVFFNGMEATFYARKAGEAKILSLPVKGVPRTMAIYPACADKPLGRKAIARIDHLLADDGKWAAYLAPLRDWVSEAEFAEALAAQPVKAGRP